MVLGGLEPPTSGLLDLRSSHLSHKTPCEAEAPQTCTLGMYNPVHFLLGYTSQVCICSTFYAGILSFHSQGAHLCFP